MFLREMNEVLAMTAECRLPINVAPHVSLEMWHISGHVRKRTLNGSNTQKTQDMMIPTFHFAEIQSYSI